MLNSLGELFTKRENITKQGFTFVILGPTVPNCHKQESVPRCGIKWNLSKMPGTFQRLRKLLRAEQANKSVSVNFFRQVFLGKWSWRILFFSLLLFSARLCNVALDKPTRQSSTSGDGPPVFASSQAVDGEHGTSYFLSKSKGTGKGREKRKTLEKLKYDKRRNL